MTVIRPGAVQTNLYAFRDKDSVVEEVDPESAQVQLEVSGGMRKVRIMRELFRS